MIRVVGSDLKKLLSDEKYASLRTTLYDRVIGYYCGEEVFLCPYLSLDRDDGICDICKWRFKCFTMHWFKIDGGR